MKESWLKIKEFNTETGDFLQNDVQETICEV
jgi:hypothetical protein